MPPPTPLPLPLFLCLWLFLAKAPWPSSPAQVRPGGRGYRAMRPAEEECDPTATLALKGKACGKWKSDPDLRSKSGLTTLGQETTLTLPDGVGERTFKRKDGGHPDYEPQGYYWHGMAEEGPGGEWMGEVVFTMQHGIFTGTVTCPEGVFRVLPPATGGAVLRGASPSDLMVVEVDLSGTTPHGGRRPDGGTGSTGKGVGVGQGRARARQGEIAQNATEINELRSLMGTGGTINILIVYTSKARDSAGGKNEIEAAAAHAVDYSNTVYRNSGMGTRQSLVGTYDMGDFDEQTDIGFALTRITAEMTDRTSKIGQLRDSTCADLVALFVPEAGPVNADGGPNACGLAPVMQLDPIGLQESAASVTAFTCLPNTHTHEVGHNLGAKHDAESIAGGDLPRVPFAYGHRRCGPSGFLTVMAYQCPSKDERAPNVPYFSNPDITVGGRPLGLWEEAGGCAPRAGDASPCRFNALAVELGSAAAAQFRCPSPVPPAVPLAGVPGLIDSSPKTPDLIDPVLSASLSNPTGITFGRWGIILLVLIACCALVVGLYVRRRQKKGRAKGPRRTAPHMRRGMVPRNDGFQNIPPGGGTPPAPLPIDLELGAMGGGGAGWGLPEPGTNSSHSSFASSNPDSDSPHPRREVGDEEEGLGVDAPPPPTVTPPPAPYPTYTGPSGAGAGTGGESVVGKPENLLLRVPGQDSMEPTSGGSTTFPQGCMAPHASLKSPISPGPLGLPPQGVYPVSPARQTTGNEKPPTITSF